MTPAVISALCTGIAGIIGAVFSGLIAYRAHQRINALTPAEEDGNAKSGKAESTPAGT